MPRDSRIANEPARRAVIGLIMATLLAASTAWAVFLSRGLQAEHRPRLVPERIESFSLSRPDRWTRKDLKPDGDLIQSHGAQFTGSSGQRLTVLELQYDRPLPPAVAVRHVIRQLGSASVEVEGLRSLPRSGALSGIHGLAFDGERMSLFAVLTVDGTRHLALSLARQGALQPDDAALMEAVVQSARDERYSALGERLTLPVGMSIEVPGNLKALGTPGDESLSRVLFHPATNAMFFQLSMSPVDLSIAPDETQEPQVTPPGLVEDDPLPEALRDLLGRYSQLDAPNQLATRLVLAYRQRTGRQPSREVFRQFIADGQPGFAMLFDSGRQSGSFEALWGLTLEGRQAVLIELAADARAGRDVQQAALVLVQTLTGARETPPAPMPVEPPEERPADPPPHGNRPEGTPDVYD